MEEELVQLKRVLWDFVTSSPSQVDVCRLMRYYRDLTGRRLPLAKFGYRNPVSFLKTHFTDCFLFHGPDWNPILTPIAPVSSTLHVKFKEKRRSKYESTLNQSLNENLITRTFKSRNTNRARHDVEKKTSEINRQIQNKVQKKITFDDSLKNKDNSTNKSDTRYKNDANKSKSEYVRKSESLIKNNNPEYDKKHTEEVPEKKNLERNALTTTPNKDDAANNNSHYSSSSKRQQMEELQRELTEIILQEPNGVWCTHLMRMYRNRYGRELNFFKFGFNSVLKLVLTLEQCAVFEAGDDWLLQDKRAAPPHPRRFARARPPRPRTPTDPKDALPYTDYDPDIFPTDCMQLTESIPGPQLDNVEPGCKLEVIVGEVYSPSHFWMVRLGKRHNLAMEGIMDDMNKYYKHGEGRERRLLLGAVQVGHYCSSCYLGDWHRTLIVKIIDCDTVKVLYVDYGTVETVGVRELRPLRREWATLPAQALRARLAGVRPCVGGRQWPLINVQYFLDAVTDRRLVAKVVARDPQDDALEVLLIDTSMDDAVSLGDELVRARHADPSAYIATGSGECYLYPHFNALESGDTPNYAEIHAYLRDGLDLDYVEDYRRHVPPRLPPNRPAPTFTCAPPQLYSASSRTDKKSKSSLLSLPTSAARLGSPLRAGHADPHAHTATGVSRARAPVGVSLHTILSAASPVVDQDDHDHSDVSASASQASDSLSPASTMMHSSSPPLPSSAQPAVRSSPKCADGAPLPEPLPETEREASVSSPSLCRALQLRCAAAAVVRSPSLALSTASTVMHSSSPPLPSSTQPAVRSSPKCADGAPLPEPLPETEREASVSSPSLCRALQLRCAAAAVVRSPSLALSTASTVMHSSSPPLPSSAQPAVRSSPECASAVPAWSKLQSLRLRLVMQKTYGDCSLEPLPETERETSDSLSPASTMMHSSSPPLPSSAQPAVRSSPKCADGAPLPEPLPETEREASVSSPSLCRALQLRCAAAAVVRSPSLALSTASTVMHSSSPPLPSSTQPAVRSSPKCADGAPLPEPLPETEREASVSSPSLCRALQLRCAAAAVVRSPSLALSTASTVMHSSSPPLPSSTQPAVRSSPKCADGAPLPEPLPETEREASVSSPSLCRALQLRCAAAAVVRSPSLALSPASTVMHSSSSPLPSSAQPAVCSSPKCADGAPLPEPLPETEREASVSSPSLCRALQLRCAAAAVVRSPSLALSPASTVMHSSSPPLPSSAQPAVRSSPECASAVPAWSKLQSLRLRLVMQKTYGDCSLEPLPETEREASDSLSPASTMMHSSSPPLPSSVQPAVSLSPECADGARLPEPLPETEREDSVSSPSLCRALQLRCARAAPPK